MKLNNILFATLASAIAFASCSKVKNEITTSEFDSSKTPVTSLTYIEEGSTDTKAVFEIDATAAKQAGATSVTIFLAKDMDDDVLANSAYFQNIDIDGEEPFQVTLSSITSAGDGAKYNLKKGDLFIPMVRANYPPFVHSEWTKVYAVGSDRLALEVGYGMKAVVFEQPAGISCKATDETIDVTWRRVPYAQAYTVEFREGNQAEWNIIDGIKAEKNSYTIEGVKYYTPYEVRVKAVNRDDETEYTASSITTEKTYKLRTKDMVIEFFSERAATAGAKDEFKLMNDIDMEGATLPAVASYAGIFNGQGFALKNLKITEPLFTELNGTVKDLIIDASCTIEPSSTFFAPIALKNNGSLTNVTNNAAVKYESSSAVTGGTLLAGIVVYNYGTVSKCVNAGDVSYLVNGPSEPWGVAGIAAFNGNTGIVSECVNNGKVTSAADYCSAKKAIGDITFSVVGCTGGIVAYERWKDKDNEPTVTKCINNGEVNYNISAMNRYAGSGGMNRNQIGGIVAAPDGDITECTNNGKVTARLENEAGTTNAREYLVGVGGISGGDYFASNSQNNTNIVDCFNHGDIEVFSNHASSNNTVGGITAWPGYEGAAYTAMTTNCYNDGNISVYGTLKCRVGGVQGGSGNMEGCVNAGKIIIGESVHTASVAGSLCGFHSNGAKIVNCSAFGSVTSLAEIAGVGGLVGNFGNAAHTVGTGCVINCELNCTKVTGLGLVAGTFNGTSKVITVGDAASPVKVAGKVNGTTVTADNYLDYVHGSTNFSATNHVFHTVYGE